MRVAFHAINGVGLGHLARATCLLREVRDLLPGARLLVVTNAGDVSMLERAGLDYVRLPPRAAEPHADPGRCRRALFGPLERAALAAVYETFAPDLAAFDTHAPPWLVEHAAALGARTAFVLRELRPAALSAWLASPEALGFDRIVVPHEPGEVDLGAAPADLPLVCVGPVVRLGRGEAGGGDGEAGGVAAGGAGPFVVALAGGGGQPVDARRFVRAVADAHWLARARVPGLRTLLVTGPYGRPPGGVEGFEGLEVVAGSGRVGELLAGATLAVTQAGYNTVAELRALGVPAVLVPGARKAEDQRARARRLAAAGAAVVARPEARVIADAVEGLLARPGALAAMRAAHAARPLRPKNREAAEALLRPAWRPAGPPRRVAFVAHDFAPKLGGMETVARELARHVRAAGVEPVVYATRGLAPPDAPGLEPGAVRPIFRPAGSPPRIDLWGDLVRLVGALLRDPPDAVHLCHAGLAPWVRPLRAALPCAVTCHAHGNDLLAPWVHHGGGAAAYDRARARGLAEADAVFAVSRFTRALLEARGLAPGRARLLYGGVDAERFRPGEPDRALGARYGLGADDEVLLTVSRLAPRKGHRVAIAALARLAPARPRLVYAFTGESPRLRDELRAEARALGVEGRLRSLGRVPEADLPGLYRLARAFVLLSDGGEGDVEGFGIALLEAAASGLPALVARSGGMVEAVDEGATGLVVPPGDAEAAAAALATLLGGGARAMGEAARRRAEASFSWASAARGLVDAWGEALAAPRRARRPTGLGAALGRAEVGEGGRPAELRRALGDARDGASLARLARAEAYAERRARAAREGAFRRGAARGRVPAIRATGEGFWLLPEALEACEAAGVRPEVEVKLRRFLEPEFAAHCLPRVSAVSLVHGVPSEGADELVERVRARAGSLGGAVRSLRLFLSPEARAEPARALGALPEAHALRRAFAGAGVAVLPPPELARYLSETPAGRPATAMVEPTNACNLRCPTCPTGAGKIAPKPAMRLGRFRRVLGELGPGLRNLALWNYGEPLLNPDLGPMIAAAKAAGVGVVKVSTNAHFLDRRRVEALLASGLDVLIVSLDGASQATYETFRRGGDFARAAGMIERLCAEKRRRGGAGPRVELQFIVMRHNEHEIEEVRRLAAAWGVDRLRLKTVGADDDANRALVPASRLLSRYDAEGRPNAERPFCTMAWDHTVINVDGSVTPCCYLRPDMGEAFVMGNAFETPFVEIWRGAKYRAFRAAMLAGRRAMPVCGACRGGTHDLLAAVEEVGAP